MKLNQGNSFETLKYNFYFYAWKVGGMISLENNREVEGEIVSYFLNNV